MSARVTIYKDSDFKGEAKSFDEGDYDVDKLGIGNDAVSSIKVPPGMQITLFQDSHWRGASKTFRADAPRMDSWNDRASSIQVRTYPPTSTPRVTVYQDSRFAGSFEYLEPGEYPTPAQLAIGNDAISSVRIPEGLLAILYQDANFGGRVVGLDIDQYELGSVDFNDRTSSIRVVNEAQYRRHLRQPSPNPSPGDILRLTGFVRPVETTPPVLIGETLIPFMHVSETYPANLQAKESAYYALSRESYWKLGGYKEHSGAYPETVVIEIKNGVSVKTNESTKETLRIEFSASGAFSVAGIKANIGTKLSRDLELVQSTETVTNEERKVTYTYEFPAGNHYAIAVWQLVDRYTLRRLPSGQVVSTWEVAPEGHQIEDAWPEVPANTSTVSKRSVSRGW